MAGKPCKYFLQGRCKFGANCRFNHPTGNDTSNDRGWGNSRSGGYEPSALHSNDFNRGWGSKQSSNRFQLFSETDAGGGGGRYQSRDSGQNQRNPFDHSRLGTKSGGGQDRWSNQRGGQNQWSNHRGGQNQWSNHRGGQNQWSNQRGGQNQWSNQRGDQNQWSNHRGQQDRWSNRRGDQDRRWNSRDDPKGNYGNSQQGNDEPTSPREIAEMIRQDMEEWVTSEMWPLSCYAYAKETPCIEGFVDISTHELRWEAYQAFASGNAAKYVQTVNELVEKQMGVKKQFNSITADDVLSMKSGTLFGGSDGGSSLFGAASQSTGTMRRPSLFSDTDTSKSSVFAPSPTGPTTSSMFGGQSLFGSTQQPVRSATMEPLTSLFPAQPNPQTLPTANITRAATQPSSTVTQATDAVPPSVGGGSSLEDIINFTKCRQLTKDEIDSYNIDKFVLGSLPEHAPPVM